MLSSVCVRWLAADAQHAAKFLAFINKTPTPFHLCAEAGAVLVSEASACLLWALGLCGLRQSCAQASCWCVGMRGGTLEVVWNEVRSMMRHMKQPQGLVLPVSELAGIMVRHRVRGSCTLPLMLPRAPPALLTAN